MQSDTDIKAMTMEMGRTARHAARTLAASNSSHRNNALLEMARSIHKNRDEISKANALDVAEAQSSGLDSAMQDRLVLNKKRIDAMVEGLKEVVNLPDPINDICDLHEQSSGIRVGCMHVPLGVVAVIYESRPNVTADAAALLLKSGNAAILRGGSESLRSNLAIAACIQRALAKTDLPESAVQVVPTANRDVVGVLLGMTEYVDMLVPRGGKSLVARIASEARVPLLKHLDGICHVYVDEHADADMAFRIAVNSKTQRYGVCNAAESLLVHQSVAPQLLPRLATAYAEAGVELRGCERAMALLPDINAATEEDWRTEYLGPILSIRVVPDIDGAIEHINTYGSQHTDTIVTDNPVCARRFLQEVDSSSVMHNVSTRFADGFEYGLGAEIGISTDKLHARGPVGLLGLTSRKYVVLGDGNIRN